MSTGIRVSTRELCEHLESLPVIQIRTTASIGTVHTEEEPGSPHLIWLPGQMSESVVLWDTVALVASRITGGGARKAVGYIIVGGHGSPVVLAGFRLSDGMIRHHGLSYFAYLSKTILQVPTPTELSSWQK